MMWIEGLEETNIWLRKFYRPYMLRRLAHWAAETGAITIEDFHCTVSVITHFALIY